MQKHSCFHFYHPLLLCPLDLGFVLLLVWPTIAFSEFSIISCNWLKNSNHPKHTTISAGWLFKRCFHVPSNHMSAIMSVTFPPPHREKVIITHKFRASTLSCVLWALGAWTRDSALDPAHSASILQQVSTKTQDSIYRKHACMVVKAAETLTQSESLVRGAHRHCSKLWHGKPWFLSLALTTCGF